MTECTLEASHMEKSNVNARLRMVISASCNELITASSYALIESRKSGIAAKAVSVFSAKYRMLGSFIVRNFPRSSTQGFSNSCA